MMDLQLSKQRREEIKREVRLERRSSIRRGRGATGTRWFTALGEELKIDIICLRKSFGVLRVSRKRKEKV